MSSSRDPSYCFFIAWDIIIFVAYSFWHATVFGEPYNFQPSFNFLFIFIANSLAVSAASNDSAVIISYCIKTSCLIPQLRGAHVIVSHLSQTNVFLFKLYHILHKMSSFVLLILNLCNRVKNRYCFFKQ